MDLGVGVHVMSHEYYRFLIRTISTAGQDPAQLRAIVYHYARSRLRKELSRRKGLHWAQIKEQMSALEKAIEQVESDVGDGTMFRSFNLPLGAVTHPTFLPRDTEAEPSFLPADTETQPTIFATDTAAQSDFRRSEETALAIRQDLAIIETTMEEIEPDIYDRRAIVETRFDSIPTIRPTHAALWSTMRLVMAVVLGVGLFATIQGQTNLHSFFMRQARDDVAGARPIVSQHEGQTTMHSASSLPPAPVTVQAQESIPGLDLRAANIPVPTSYGVYAVSHGKLVDLQTLPIRVPDERVGISALFSTPSESTLQDGRLQFIAFRRDLANNAPDRVMVRVVARVMRALTFDAKGNAKLINVEASWGVRSNHYQMQVAPVNGNREMVIIRPMNPNFVFSAGRYALVLQGSAYDFTVAGRITDTAQCLERTDTIDTPIYSECRTL